MKPYDFFFKKKESIYYILRANLCQRTDINLCFSELLQGNDKDLHH